MDPRGWCRRGCLALAAPLVSWSLSGCSLERLLRPATKRNRTRAAFQAGPWTGVFDAPESFDASPSELRDAINVDIPDPENGSGAYARNGFALANNGAAVPTFFS